MEWRRGHTLGRGSTATVSIAEESLSGQVFAVKSAELRQSEALKREQGILSKLNSPQIVAYKGCDVKLENGALVYNLFMEYAPHGTLADAAAARRRKGGGIGEPLAAYYTRQVLLGLDYLHSKGIVHCDLKGQNVLVTEQGAKIADFGCARRVEDSGGVIAGTPAFMAPEVARGEKQGFPADVWALGCTVLEMITGEAPWQGVSEPVTALYRIGFSGEAPEIPDHVSETVKDFLGKCWKRDPCERWTAAELLGHGFVAAASGGFEFESELETPTPTPTSVLDPGFWEKLETEQDLTATTSGRCCMDRIRGLCVEDGGPTCWECDYDDWITVRSNAVQRNEFEVFQNVNEAEANVKTEDCNCGTVSGIVFVTEENNNCVLVSHLIAITTGLATCTCSDCYLNKEALLYGCPSIMIVIVPQGKFDSHMHKFLASFFISAFTAPNFRS